jgi:antitoxin YefM
MRGVRVSDNIVPISDLKARAAEWLRRTAETGAPIVVTQNGKAAGVLLSPASYDELIERARFVAAVEEGLADADADRVHAHADVARAVKARLRARRR